MTQEKQGSIREITHQTRKIPGQRFQPLGVVGETLQVSGQSQWVE